MTQISSGRAGTIQSCTMEGNLWTGMQKYWLRRNTLALLTWGACVFVCMRTGWAVPPWHRAGLRDPCSLCSVSPHPHGYRRPDRCAGATPPPGPRAFQPQPPGGVHTLQNPPSLFTDWRIVAIKVGWTNKSMSRVLLLHQGFKHVMSLGGVWGARSKENDITLH